MAAFTAFYDANVLYPAELRNLLMHLALTGLFRAKWSAGVHEEWISSLLEKRPDLTRDKLNRTRALMDKYAVDALVTGYEAPKRKSGPRPADDLAHIRVHPCSSVVRPGACTAFSSGWMM